MTADEIVLALRLFRQVQGLSLAQLSKAMGRRSAAQVLEWETGHHIPSLVIATEWAAVLGLRLELVPDSPNTGEAPPDAGSDRRRSGGRCG